MTLREESLSKTKHLLNKETLFKKKKKIGKNKGVGWGLKRMIGHVYRRFACWSYALSKCDIV